MIGKFKDWDNYVILSEQVDLDAMSPETLDAHIENSSPVRPFKIAAWLGRQGYFIAAWALWEYYSRSLCQGLPNNEKRAGHDPTVRWVAKSLAANGEAFAEVGEHHENGGWPPHLHFQIVGDIGSFKGDFPGVAAPFERERFLELCPDPNLILGIPGL